MLSATAAADTTAATASPQKPQTQKPKTQNTTAGRPLLLRHRHPLRLLHLLLLLNWLLLLAFEPPTSTGSFPFESHRAPRRWPEGTRGSGAAVRL